VVAGSQNSQRNHLQLAFGCEGGGGGGTGGQNDERNHLQLAFECEGGEG
jgi:hypothetical protein